VGSPRGSRATIDGGMRPFDGGDVGEEREGRELAERLGADTALRGRLFAYAWRRFGIRPSEAAETRSEARGGKEEGRDDDG